MALIQSIGAAKDIGLHYMGATADTISIMAEKQAGNKHRGIKFAFDVVLKDWQLESDYTITDAISDKLGEATLSAVCNIGRWCEQERWRLVGRKE